MDEIDVIINTSLNQVSMLFEKRFYQIADKFEQFQKEYLSFQVKEEDQTQGSKYNSARPTPSMISKPH